ncbi:MAG: EamA family transporter, partial [Actinomycetes bacterium]
MLLTPRPVTQSALWLALVTVYVVWGSTYLAIRVIVETSPPLLSMGVRFVLAGLILGLVLALRHGPSVLKVDGRALGSAALVGTLLLLCGNGGVAVAEQTVPSGQAALLVSAVPLWLVCMRRIAGDVPRRMTVVGTALGFAGIAVLARPGGHDTGGEPVELWGVLLVLFATVCWAFGSFFTARLPMPGNAFVATTYEMLVAGALMLVVGSARGELDGFALGDVPGEAWAWLAYLVVFGSLVAFSSYVWLLHHAPISLVATYAYVNPVVAVALGALVLSEPVTLAIVGGGAIAVTGVMLVVSTERRRAA